MVGLKKKTSGLLLVKKYMALNGQKSLSCLIRMATEGLIFKLEKDSLTAYLKLISRANRLIGLPSKKQSY